jgi:hypothetical protein
MGRALRRDDFTEKVKQAMAKRVGFRCSNPDCRKLTVGPGSQPMQTISVGVAAHITAASIGGPRYDGAITEEQRRAIANGVWLCQTCGTLVDRDEQRYSITILGEWKNRAEASALEAIQGYGQIDHYTTFGAVCRSILPLLEENNLIFVGYGPNSGANNQGPVHFDLGLWYRAREATIRPNNQRIVEIFDAYRTLIPADAVEPVGRFRLHVQAFAAHCEDRVIKYEGHRFPLALSEVVRRYAAGP